RPGLAEEVPVEGAGAGAAVVLGADPLAVAGDAGDGRLGLDKFALRLHLLPVGAADLVDVVGLGGDGGGGAGRVHGGHGPDAGRVLAEGEVVVERIGRAAAADLQVVGLAVLVGEEAALGVHLRGVALDGHQRVGVGPPFAVGGHGVPVHRVREVGVQAVGDGHGVRVAVLVVELRGLAHLGQDRKSVV